MLLLRSLKLWDRELFPVIVTDLNVRGINWVMSVWTMVETDLLEYWKRIAQILP